MIQVTSGYEAGLNWRHGRNWLPPSTSALVPADPTKVRARIPVKGSLISKLSAGTAVRTGSDAAAFAVTRLGPRGGQKEREYARVLDVKHRVPQRGIGSRSSGRRRRYLGSNCDGTHGCWSETRGLSRRRTHSTSSMKYDLRARCGDEHIRSRVPSLCNAGGHSSQLADSGADFTDV